MKKTLAIVLIVLTLLPTVGLSIGTHICGGEQKEHKIVLDVNSLQCDMKMEMAKSACPLHPAKDASDTKKQKNTCCDDVLISIETDDYQSVRPLDSIQKLEIVAFDFEIYSIASELLASQVSAHNHLERFKQFPPPLIHTVIQPEILFQSFLN